MTAFPELQIRSALADYSVVFSDLADLSQWRPQADALLVDSFFRGRLALPEDLPVIWVEATEEAKALPATLEVFVALKQAGFGRGSHLLAIGGGVVQDIATFVASLYMRGIAWSYVPTTFLGMTDSCLGGKSSINVGPYKNLIGNFHPPRRIDILPAFARTLPPVELAGGAAEAAKIAFCRGAEAFARYEALAAPVLAGAWREDQLAQLLHATLAVKQWFIETDEFDRAERRLLNFGHTWGHALESATGFAIPHGLAVGLGMLASLCFVADRSAAQAVVPAAHTSLWNHCLALLCPVLHQDQLNCFAPDDFASAFRADKKHAPDHFHLIVPASSVAPTALGVEEIRLPATDASLSAILSSMQTALAAVGSDSAFASTL
ncbi:MAG: 3-dehydroquinate synthase [Prochlorococcaceae cyanobacterium MAG_34]|jgi:3-dehydroquinate synthase|nr:3-dehydroquinate synthase [Prochlorococcaceae cyanobacterium MAG_34]